MPNSLKLLSAFKKFEFDLSEILLFAYHYVARNYFHTDVYTKFTREVRCPP